MTKKSALLLFFVLLKFVLQFAVINPAYELHRDEFLHLDQGKHLAWGYLSVPPFTSWISWVILHLGHSVFWVKFFPALFGALTIVVVWKIIEELKGNVFALILGSTAILFSALLRINLLYQPNSLDVLFWTLLYFTLVKYIHSENSNWLWAASLVFGFGFLNKYTIAFLLLGILPALLLTEHRKVFANKTLYLSMALAVLIISPNLIWQYRNSFPVIYHMQLLAKTQLANVERSGFLKEQLLFFFSSFFVLIAAIVSFFRFAPFRTYRVIFWSYAFTLSLFVYFRAKGYYAIGLYPVLLAFGAVYLEHLTSKGWRKYLQPLLILLPVILFLPITRVALPIDSPEEITRNGTRFKNLGLLRWEDGKDHILPQDFADMLGWKELAAKVDRVYDSIPDKTSAIVICDNYGQAGAINYYSAHTTMQAVSLNADYIHWFPLDHEIRNVILVTEADDDDPQRKKEKPLFTSVYLSGQIENRYAREQGTHIYVLKKSKAPVNTLIQGDINEREREQ